MANSGADQPCSTARQTQRGRSADYIHHNIVLYLEPLQSA